MDGAVARHPRDAVRLPFRDASFDWWYSFGVLRCRRARLSVAEIHRRAQAGGTVITMFYNRRACTNYLKTLYYYGIVLRSEELWAARNLTTGFTDGFGYPRTYHQHRTSSAAFDRFTTERLLVAKPHR